MFIYLLFLPIFMAGKLTLEQRYTNALDKWKADKTICKDNRDLLVKFLEWESYKLKRKNNLRSLDDGCYKTLTGYITKFRNVNKWFNNKSIKDLTKADIKKVYDGLEDGNIKRVDGNPFENLDDSYYSKIFKSKLFEMAGKKELSKEVIEFTTKRKKEVRYIKEEQFREIVNAANKDDHRLLLWLAFDIGENINALLKLKESDFTEQINPHTKEKEYRVNLRQDILKRSRKARSEITNYNDTVKLLDRKLKKLKDSELLFKFGYGTAKKFLTRLVQKLDLKCVPNGESVTWKDLRSGMSCDLLLKGWTTDEINSRLGHRPSSNEIDKYVNHLALDRHRPKKKMQQFEMEKVKEELEAAKQREKLTSNRLESLQNDIENLKKMFLQQVKDRIDKKK